MNTANGNAPDLNYIDFTAAANSLPNRPHPATLWRWARRGVLVRGSSQRIHLKHVRAGGRVLTTRLWLDQFMSDLADADLEHFSVAPTVATAPSPKRGERTPEQRAAASAAARERILGSSTARPAA